MNTKSKINKYLYTIIGLLFCFMFIGSTNIYAQITIDESPPPNDSMIVYTHADTIPKFPGNMNKYFADSIRYPEDAIEKKIQGVVFLNVIIERDGSISNITVLRSPNNSLSIEAKRVVSTMPKWTPGKQKGKVVRVQSLVPIHFNLPPSSGGAIKK